MLRVLNIIMLFVFLLSAAVQYNDPDGWLWIIYYAVAAVITAFAIANRYTPLAALAAIAYYIGAAWYLPAWSSDTVLLLREPKMSSPDVELARESFGLLICAVWMTVLAVVWYRRRGANPQPASNAPAFEER